MSNFIWTRHFPAKLRLLHQCFTGGLHCIILNYEARLCYYEDDISSNSEAGQQNTGTHCYGHHCMCFQKTCFYHFQFVYGSLSVYRHNRAGTKAVYYNSNIRSITFELFEH